MQIISLYFTVLVLSLHLLNNIRQLHGLRLGLGSGLVLRYYPVIVSVYVVSIQKVYSMYMRNRTVK